MVRTAWVVAVSVMLGLVGGASAGAATSARPHIAGAHLRPPVATGTLRIDGTLRDGAWVHAAGLTWRPSVVPTVGVQFLPGFKNERVRP